MSCELIFGECIEQMAGMPAGGVDLVLADLPYGTTSCKWDTQIPFAPLWEQYRRVTKPNAAIVLFAQSPFDKALGASNLPMLKYEWIWEKEAGTGFLNAKKYPLKSHENILVFCAGLHPYFPQMAAGKPYVCKKGGDTSVYRPDVSADIVTVNEGVRYPKTVLKFPRDRQKIHPTQKPVALLEYLIKTYTRPGELVLDNAMGSGSTGVAALNTGRRFVGIERDAKWYAAAHARIGGRAAA